MENLQRAFGGEGKEFEKRKKVKETERVKERLGKNPKREGGSGLGRDKETKSPSGSPWFVV